MFPRFKKIRQKVARIIENSNGIAAGESNFYASFAKYFITKTKEHKLFVTRISSRQKIFLWQPTQRFPIMKCAHEDWLFFVYSNGAISHSERLASASKSETFRAERKMPDLQLIRFYWENCLELRYAPSESFLSFHVSSSYVSSRECWFNDSIIYPSDGGKSV